MSGKINLSKVQECNQTWDSMSKCEGGRLCSKCQHVIVDFRGKSDWEVAFRHAQSEEKVCGIYDKEGRNTNRKANFLPSSPKKLLVAGTIGLLATNVPLFSQGTDAPGSHAISGRTYSQEFTSDSVNVPKNLQGRNSDKNDRSFVLTGTVKDQSGELLSGATIWVKDTRTGAFTDTEGQFEIDLTEPLLEMKKVSIVVSYIGYGREERAISRADYRTDNKLKIEIVVEEKMEISVFRVSRPPFHKRAWYSFKGIFRKKN